MALPEGVHTVRYTLTARDLDADIDYLEAALTLPFRGNELEQIDAAIEAGIQTIVDQLQPGIPIPIQVKRWYDATVQGVFPTPPPEEA